MRPHTAGRLAAAIWLPALLISSAPAHEGHDHGEPAANITAPAAPRAEASSDAFELVAVARGGTLTIYLDRLATNEPVTDASIAVETPQGSVDAEQAADGSYRIAAPWSVAPGSYDLIFTVSKGATADVLPLTLTAPPGEEASAPAAGMSAAAAARRSNVHVAVVATAALLVGAIGGLLAGGLLKGRRKRGAAALLLVCTLLIGTALLSPRAFAHDGDDHGAAATAQPAVRSDVAQVLGDGSVFVPKSTQRILAIRTMHDAGRPCIAARSSCPVASFPTRMPAATCRRSVGGRLSPPAGGFPRLGARGEEGRRPRLCHAAVAGDRRLRHAAAAGRARPADLHRRAPGRPLRDAGAERRGRPHAARGARLELQGLQGPARRRSTRVRREPEALVAPVDGVDRRRHAGRRPDRADQCRRVPHHRSGAAVGRGAQLRGAAGAGSGRPPGSATKELNARLPRRRLRRPQPVDPGPLRDRRRHHRPARRASS